MRKIFLNLSLAALSFMLVGCNAEEGMLTPDGNPQNSDRTFVAYLEGGDGETKTYLDGERLMWNAGETIGIYEDYGLAMSKYQISPETVGTNAGTFNLVSTPEIIEGAGSLEGWNVAVYPYNEDISCEIDPSVSVENPTFTLNQLNIPKTQLYLPVDELENTYPMMAISHNDVLHFRNIQGLIKLNLIGDQKVTGIELFGNSGEQLCGNFFVDMDVREYIPHLRPADLGDERNPQYKSIYLKCVRPVQLNQAEPTTFTFNINPTEFVEGFRFIVSTEGGQTYILESMKSLSVKRSHALVMPPRPLRDYGKVINYGTVEQSDAFNESGLRFEDVNELPAEWWSSVTISYDPWEGRIYIPANDMGVVEIPDKAFYYCQSLEWIEIPEEVTRIGAHAFDHCTFLKRVKLPQSLTTLGNYAFTFCKIKEIALPETLTNMPVAAFEACSDLSTVKTMSVLEGTEIIRFHDGLPTQITEIGDRAFGKTALTGFALHEGLLKIGEQAFYTNPIKNITIPASVEYIGGGAFSVCPNIGNVNVLSETPAILGQFAFGEPLTMVPNLKILVPQSALDTYKVEWEYYAERISGR